MPTPSALQRHTCLPCVARPCLSIQEFPVKVHDLDFKKDLASEAFNKFPFVGWRGAFDAFSARCPRGSVVCSDYFVGTLGLAESRAPAG